MRQYWECFSIGNSPKFDAPLLGMLLYWQFAQIQCANTDNTSLLAIRPNSMRQYWECFSVGNAPKCNAPLLGMHFYWQCGYKKTAEKVVFFCFEAFNLIHGSRYPIYNSSLRARPKKRKFPFFRAGNDYRVKSVLAHRDAPILGMLLYW